MKPRIWPLAALLAVATAISVAAVSLIIHGVAIENAIV